MSAAHRLPSLLVARGFLMLAAALVFARPAQAQQIAAAADLQFALPEVLAAWVKRGEAMPRVAYGSSGTFARQILQGAPFELFLSADPVYVDQLIAARRTLGVGEAYAIGRLALFIPEGSNVALGPDLADFVAAVRDGRVRRLALANPEHAPYGRAAREVLQRLGLWQVLQGRLAQGDNAAQATQFVASGAAHAGLIPLSLARAPQLAGKGRYVTLPEHWHTPLRQTRVLVQGAGDAARRLSGFLQTDEAQAILQQHGFGLP